MRNSSDVTAAAFIAAAAVACAVALLLVPGLFAGFGAGRLAAVVALAGAGFAFAVLARRFRRRQHGA